MKAWCFCPSTTLNIISTVMLNFMRLTYTERRKFVAIVTRLKVEINWCSKIFANNIANLSLGIWISSALFWVPDHSFDRPILHHQLIPHLQSYNDRLHPVMCCTNVPLDCLYLNWKHYQLQLLLNFMRHVE